MSLQAVITTSDDGAKYVTLKLDGRELDCEECGWFPKIATVGRWCRKYRKEPRFCRHMTCKGYRLLTPTMVQRIQAAMAAVELDKLFARR